MDSSATAQFGNGQVFNQCFGTELGSARDGFATGRRSSHARTMADKTAIRAVVNDDAGQPARSTLRNVEPREPAGLAAQTVSRGSHGIRSTHSSCRLTAPEERTNPEAPARAWPCVIGSWASATASVTVADRFVERPFLRVYRSSHPLAMASCRRRAASRCRRARRSTSLRCIIELADATCPRRACIALLLAQLSRD